MSRKTQRYSKEFKAEAVRTVLENQLSISEGASRLSLPEVKWHTEFGHLNRGDMLTSEQHRCSNEKKKF
ncbi:putative transposase [Shigella boydii 5216-82]|nr:putative transposase [Shigella boydii 5216-82]